MVLFVYRSRKFNRLYALVLFLYAVWFTVGLFVLGLGLQTPFGPWADFIFIALAALVLLLHLAGQFPTVPVLLVFLWFTVLSGVVEGVGAVTGFPFGDYFYTGNFGPILFGVLPLAIPLAWWVVVWPIHCLVHSALAGRGSILWVPIVTGVIAVVADLMIEPAATLVRNYWNWDGSGVYYGVPWQNFLGWFGVAFVLSFFSQVFLSRGPFKREELRVPLWVLLSTIGTFVLVSLVSGKWLVLLVAIVFCAMIRRLWVMTRPSGSTH
ncbi:MAG: carotenoid biosynthesis protein [Verrucomicrobiota bacterium]